MSDQYGGTGLGWLAIVFFSFALGYILTKLKVLTEQNAPSFCLWAPAVVVAIMVFRDGLGNMSITTIAGKAAMFLILWFVFALLFTFGVLLGKEKADKK